MIKIKGKALLKSLFRIILGTLLAIPLLLYPLLYFFQDYLLFHPRKISEEELAGIRRMYPGAEITLMTPDNIQLHGWYVKADGAEKSPLLIYFGGNAEEVSGRLFSDRIYLKGWSLLLVNYRGYGLSQGVPSEESFFKDALLIYDTFAGKDGVDGNKIVTMGRSVGTGVAVYLAAQRPVKGLVLVSPYDSITSVAQNAYPYAPMPWLLKHPFDALSKAPAISAPMLALIAENDRIIPHPHSEKLLAAWGGPTVRQIIADTDHNTITGGEHYWSSILSFLNSL
ncbi:MAG: alpha/beta hydrolase [Gammaproteobacteria bacterium]|nr:alpha/beta hydrolase [Gammaproteobacteria bacterium]